MEHITPTHSRRSFLRSSFLAGGGLLISFTWYPETGLAEFPPDMDLPDQWNELNGYIKITPYNVVKIMAPNPEFGQNVKTAIPMIIAEELDVDWKGVVVEQAPFNPKLFTRQFTGGSQGIRSAWKPLRTAGASAREMLRTAAAQTWGVPLEEVTTKAGSVYHERSGKSATYGSIASKAAEVPVPKDVKLKDVKEFTVVRNSKKNVESANITAGKSLFGMDYAVKGMQIAMVQHPPAFGMKLKSYDASAAKKMPGITDVFTIDVFPDDYERGAFDTRTFNRLIVVVGKTTWQVMQARKKLVAQWEPISETKEPTNNGGRKGEIVIPAGLESSEEHYKKMEARAKEPAQQLRKDGDPEAVFKNAAQIIEHTYTAPFLAHNPMEPINCFAHVTEDKAMFVCPIQAPEFIARTLSARLKLPFEKIEINLARMGGGFGRRAYGHYIVEAALISQQTKSPIKLIYMREDDMTYGIYRPMYMARYRAALDANKNLIGFSVTGGGIPEHPIAANRFPAGAVDNYLAEGWALPSNITIGAFRAPRSNFNAAAEQSFLDEVAEAMGKDPIDFRLELLQRSKDIPVGKNNDYNADRYMGVLQLVKEKSGWGKPENAKYSRGVAAYFCHNSYAAHVVDIVMRNGLPYVERVFSAVDCGIVVNPDAATNMVEGAVIDGIGNAFYGKLSHKDGAPEQTNFNRYRMIRHSEAPVKIEVHFVQNDIDPTGLGEPPFPPVFGAVANALYKSTGKRYYSQPFIDQVLDTINNPKRAF